MTSRSGWLRDATGGKACADDAKVRAKATAINLSIASLPFFLGVLIHPKSRLSGPDSVKNSILLRRNLQQQTCPFSGRARRGGSHVTTNTDNGREYRSYD